MLAQEVVGMPSESLGETELLEGEGSTVGSLIDSLAKTRVVVGMSAGLAKVNIGLYTRRSMRGLRGG